MAWAAAEQAKATDNAIVAERKVGARREAKPNEVGGFEPKRPTVVDRRKVLEGVAKRCAGSPSRTPRSDPEE